MEASGDTPSNRSALTAFGVMLAVPWITFGIAVYAAVKLGTEWAGYVLLAAYPIGTVPGLVVGARYLGKSNFTETPWFSLGYMLACVGVLAIQTLFVGCMVTNVCP